MSKIAENSFRTKAGTCVITPSQIVLERQGLLGAIGKYVYGNNIYRALAIYGILGAELLTVGIWLLIAEDFLGAVLLCLVGVFFVGNVFLNWNASAAPTIDRSNIQSVSTRRPRPPLTRGYFVVWFSKNGKARKRFIMLRACYQTAKRNTDEHFHYSKSLAY